MVTILNTTMPTFDEEGIIHSSGVVDLSNGIDVWFSPIHTIKTAKEAKEVANKICKSLNQED